MTRKTRRILFLFLLISFLLVAPLTVFYSLGWRIDWKTKKIIQPGVFYLKIQPKNAKIYLNGELEEKTDFFFGSAFIDNLLPKEYDLEVKKEGFYTWKKTLEIKPRQVTEIKNIILIPEDPGFAVLSKGVKDFFFFPDNKKVILKEEKITNSETEKISWSLKLFDLEKNVKSHLIEDKDISQKEVSLLDLEFSYDSKKVLLKVGAKEQIMYYLLEVNEAPVILTLIDFLDSDVQEISFNPKNSQKLFVLKAGVLSEEDLFSKETSSNTLVDVITFSIFRKDIYYLDESGFLFKTNLSLGPRDKLNMLPLSLKAETEYKIDASNYNIILKESNILYTFDKDKKIFEKIFEPVTNFEFSPGSTKMAYFNNNEIWILFLIKKYEQPQKLAGEQLFLIRLSEKIDEVFWYTDHYLIFKAGGKIKIAEIDDRDLINIVELAEFKTPKIFWNQNNKKLFVISDGNFYVSKKIVP